MKLAFCLWIFAALGVNHAYSDSDPVSIEWIRQKIEQPGGVTLEQLVTQLPTQFTRYFNLMYESGSLQEASPLYPRVILSGTDATFLMAYNGHASQDGYEKLEMIQWRADSKRFEFFEALPRPDGKLALHARKQECAGCHGPAEDLRPNWAPYSTWPGAYGSHDDVVRGRFARPGEEANLTKFLDRDFSDEPRYAAIHGLRAAYGVSKSKKDQVDTDNHSANALLTSKLAQLNFQRVARILTSHPRYSETRLLFAIASECGYNFDKFISPEMRAAFPGQQFGYNFYYYPKRPEMQGGAAFLLKYLGLDERSLSMMPPNLEMFVEQISNDHYVERDRAINSAYSHFTTPSSQYEEFLGWLSRADPELPPLLEFKEYGSYGSRESPRAQLKLSCYEALNLHRFGRTK